ncbi:MAG: hypothetical protein KDK36_19500 [Leptospiraceae bacterium]|nr:hypothetical protein [Leptospiraceae bacterium]
MEELKQLEKSGKYDELISSINNLLKTDIKNINDPYIKSWLGKRWRNIFINESSKIEKAVETATKKKIFGKDERPPKEKVAFRYLRGDGPDEWKNEFPEASLKPIKNTTLIFCPGLLSGLLPVMAFKEEFPLIKEKFDINIIQSDSHPMRSCEANMADLLNAIEKGKGMNYLTEEIKEEDAIPPEGDLFVITYSKGAADLLTLLVNRPELAPRIKCVFNWAGAPGGSYLANSIYDSIKGLKLELPEGIEIPEELVNIFHVISPAITLPKQIRRLPEYDIQGALKDLTTTARGEFLEENLSKINDLNIPFFNITGSTTAMEVPYFQLQGVLELNKYDANNDMQATQKHSKIEIPMATDLALLHGHHWDLSYGPFPERMRLGSPNLDHPFPREAALSAMILFASELGFIS